jgi:hypothetical protein
MAKHEKHMSKTRLCQDVASQHLPEPALNTTQVAKRLGRSPKTIRNWLRQQVECPDAFKDKNEWYVYLSVLILWETNQIKGTLNKD